MKETRVYMSANTRSDHEVHRNQTKSGLKSSQTTKKSSRVKYDTAAKLLLFVFSVTVRIKVPSSRGSRARRGG